MRAASDVLGGCLRRSWRLTFFLASASGSLLALRSAALYLLAGFKLHGLAEREAARDTGIEENWNKKRSAEGFQPKARQYCFEETRQILFRRNPSLI
jgi:hypothetical protein